VDHILGTFSCGVVEEPPDCVAIEQLHESTEVVPPRPTEMHSTVNVDCRQYLCHHVLLFRGVPKDILLLVKELGQ
jgi:hypothetical protein